MRAAQQMSNLIWSRLTLGFTSVEVAAVAMVFSVGRNCSSLERKAKAALASGQFGPLMLRNFIRDRGTQVTLGTFVATFVYAVLALGAIGEGGPGFVLHISVTVTLALTVADLAVFIYFVDHITTQIQLP